MGYYEKHSDIIEEVTRDEIQLSEEDESGIEMSDSVGDLSDDSQPTGVIGGAFSLLQDSD